jgi:hypothetical protein
LTSTPLGTKRCSSSSCSRPVLLLSSVTPSGRAGTSEVSDARSSAGSCTPGGLRYRRLSRSTVFEGIVQVAGAFALAQEEQAPRPQREVEGRQRAHLRRPAENRSAGCGRSPGQCG